MVPRERDSGRSHGLQPVESEASISPPLGSEKPANGFHVRPQLADIRFYCNRSENCAAILRIAAKSAPFCTL